MEAAHSLPAPQHGATRSSEPILPPSSARPAPRVEQRAIVITPTVAPPQRRTSMRAYLVGALGLAGVSVAGWFLLGEYIYG
ncbi:MAG: hypothetical protein ACLGHQ_00495 [Acidimicrobiia bacterium]